jgi:dynein heavy chain 2, cytosolic
MIETAMRSYEREFKELDMHMIDEVLDLVAF